MRTGERLRIGVSTEDPEVVGALKRAIPGMEFVVPSDGPSLVVLDLPEPDETKLPENLREGGRAVVVLGPADLGFALQAIHRGAAGYVVREGLLSAEISPIIRQRLEEGLNGGQYPAPEERDEEFELFCLGRLASDLVDDALWHVDRVFGNSGERFCREQPA